MAASVNSSPTGSPPPAFKGERRWVLGFAALVALVTTLPYLYAAAVQGPDWVFTGFVFGVEDGNSYIAKMLSGAAGAWLFRTPYTYLPQSGLLAFLPYLLLGKLTAPPAQHEQLVAWFHLFRIAGIFVYSLASYDFLAYFLGDVRLRRLGLLLAALGGGLGWLFMLLGFGGWFGGLPRGAIPGLDLPLSYYSPEAFGFLELYGLPHLAFGRAFFLWGLLAVLGDFSRLQKPEWWHRLARQPDARRFGLPEGLLAGLYFLALGLMQPATVLVAWAVLAAFLFAVFLARRSVRSLLQSVWLWRSGWGVLISAPFVAYTAWAFARDPVLSGWSAQNAILSPNPVFYLVAYGWLIPFVIVGARRLWRKHQAEALLPLAWLVIFPVLAYAPVNLQRRLTEGVWVAWLVLALAAVDRARPPGAPEAERRPLQWLDRILLAAAVLSLVPAIILLVGGLLSVRYPAPARFIPRDQAQAFTLLAEAAKPGEVVLASYAAGNALPAWAPVRVVVGHGPESVGLAELLPQVEAYFQAETPDAVRQARLAQWQVDYVFWGAQERALGDWDPKRASYLRLLGEEGAYQIYIVR